MVDVEAGHIYWTNMGVPNLNDGTIERADLDGSNRKVIIPRASHSRQSSFTSSPLMASLYPDEKTRRITSVHAWWPAG